MKIFDFLKARQRCLYNAIRQNLKTWLWLDTVFFYIIFNACMLILKSIWTSLLTTIT